MPANSTDTQSLSHFSQVDGNSPELITISGLFRSICHHKMMLGVCVFLGLLVMFGLWKITPARWQASATIQVGQMPANLQSQESANTALIEPVEQTAERIEQREQEDKALKMLGLPLGENSPRTALLRSSLRATAVRNTNFIKVSVDGFSRKEASENLYAVAQSLTMVHNIRMAPVLKYINERIANNNAQLAEGQVAINRLQAALASSDRGKSASSFAPNLLAADLLAKQVELMRKLKLENYGLSALLSPSNTYETGVVDSVFVPTQQDFPKLSIFLVAGLLLGMLAGTVLAWVADYKKRP